MTAPKRRWYLVWCSIAGTVAGMVFAPAGGPVAIATFAFSGCAMGLVVGLVLDLRQSRHRRDSRP